MEEALCWLEQYIDLLEKHEEQSFRLKHLYKEISPLFSLFCVSKEVSYQSLMTEIKERLQLLSTLCVRDGVMQIPWFEEWEKQKKSFAEWQILLIAHKDIWNQYQECRLGLQRIESQKIDLWESPPQIIQEKLTPAVDIVECRQFSLTLEMEKEEDIDEDNPSTNILLAQKLRLIARYRYLGLNIAQDIAMEQESLHQAQEVLDFHISWLLRIPKMLHDCTLEDLENIEIPTLPYTEVSIQKFIAQLHARKKTTSRLSTIFQRRYRISEELQDLQSVAARIEGGQPYIELQYIPSGNYRIGALEKQRPLITQKNGFWISMVPVTQALYRFFEPNKSGSESLVPETNLSWFHVLHFCNILSKYDGLEPCYRLASQPGQVDWDCSANGYRLPTEIEWEIAAQAGLLHLSEHKKHQRVWCRENSNAPQKVGLQSPNHHCLYDMLGNVWEWCWDADSPSNSVERIIRGGSFLCAAQDLHIAMKEKRPAMHRSLDVGFRLVRNENTDMKKL